MEETVNPITPVGARDPYEISSNAPYVGGTYNNAMSFTPLSEWFGLNSAAKHYNQRQDDLALMMAQRDMDESWYQAHDSFSAQLKELLANGVNPNLAIQSLLKTGQSSQVGSGMANVSPMPNTYDAVLGAVNSVNDFLQTSIMSDKAQAEIDELRSRAAFIREQHNWYGRLSQNTLDLGKSQRELQGSQVKVNEATISEKLSQANLNNLNAAHVKKIVDSYDDLNELEKQARVAAIGKTLAETSQAYAKIEQMKHENANIDADTNLKSSMKIKTDNEANQVALENLHLEAVNKLEAAIGRPLGADEKDIATQFINKRDFAGLERFYKVIFDTSSHVATKDMATATQLGDRYFDWAPYYRGAMPHYYNTRYYNPNGYHPAKGSFRW